MATMAPLLFDQEAGHTPRSAVCPAGTWKLRVLHVVNGEHYAGAERVQDLLALELPALGCEIGFACVKPDRFPRLRESRETPLFELPMRSRLDLSPVRELTRILREGNYDLVHTHTPRALLVSRVAAARVGVRVVHHLHSPTACDTTYRLRNWLNAAAERLSLARIGGVIAVSHSLGHYASRLGIPHRRVWVVPNGVPSRGPLADRQTPDGEWTLGMIALFRPRKGVEILLQALALLRQQGRQVRLRAVGGFETPAYEASVKDLTHQLGLSGCVTWCGFSTDVQSQLGQIDLVVLPSLFGEGLPMVVLEAMAGGTPVVATRVEGVPEAIRDGVDGLLATPNDEHDLARTLDRMLSGEVDWQTIRESAHRRHAERFSALSMAQGVLRAYQQVLVAV